MGLRKSFAKAMLLFAVISSGVLVGNLLSLGFSQPQTALAAVEDSKLDMVDSLSEAFEHASDVIRPSVVSISAAKKMRSFAPGKRFSNPFENSPFRDFFGDEFFRRHFEFRGPQDGLVQQGVGSGVIVNQDGYILTNNHVVADADELTVTLADGKKLEAKLIGTDPKTDLAVIKVKGKALKAAALGDSDTLRVGQWVVAAGNPFNLAHTITAGIVSAKGRSNVGVADYEDFIQTDAAINPGNSGGPLVNLHGEVVGINAAIFSKSGGYMGIGFAIPVNMAKSVMNSLISDGKVTRGFLGVMIQNLDEGLAESFDYQGTEGALVGSVSEGGPGDSAGIQQGDIISRFDGKKVKDSKHLRNMVAATDPGSRVEVEIFRDGGFKEIRVKLGELEDQEGDMPGTEHDEEGLGARVQTLTRDLANSLNIEFTDGVVITGVTPGGLAQLNGFRVGDVVTSVQGESISSVKEFRRLVNEKSLKKGLRLSIRRQGSQFYLFLKVEN